VASSNATCEFMMSEFSAFHVVELPTGSDVPRVECRRRDGRLAVDRLFAPLAVLARVPPPQPRHSRPEDCPRLRIIATRHAAHAPPARSVPMIGRAAA
jgi:hypothetical protein